MNLFKSIKQDLPASIVVFFVALPLCLGIALASGAPLFSGIISGIIGGIVVGMMSGSQIGVSGPAAGLAAIVLAAITQLGGFENFLVAVVLGGVIQILFGVLRAGVIGYYFPSSVIKGMLVGIGIIIFVKQIPHFLGFDNDPEGDFAFFQVDGSNAFTEIINAFGNPTLGSLVIGAFSLLLMIFWSNVLAKKAKIFTLIQGPFVVVILGIVYTLLTKDNAVWGIESKHLVEVPTPKDFDSFLGQFRFPNFSVITETGVLVTAFTIALVASLETLLCVEATDKIDPDKRITPTNRELIAQGTGNVISGMIGGLPITQVIVRSSANIQSGGKTKMAAILHGFLLLISVVTIPMWLNLIPLSVLASVLLIVGYKLANPKTFKSMLKLGWKQSVPFIITVFLVQFNLLLGIGVGLAVGILIVLRNSYKNSHFLHEEVDDKNKTVKMALAEEVTFFNKATISKELEVIAQGSHLEIDITKTYDLDFDVVEILDDYIEKAKMRDISIKIISKRGIFENPENFHDILSKPIKK